jgi:hypothetical protein
LAHAAVAPLRQLTPKQRMCIELRASHMSAKEIGKELGISPHTTCTIEAPREAVCIPIIGRRPQPTAAGASHRAFRTCGDGCHGTWRISDAAWPGSSAYNLVLCEPLAGEHRMMFTSHGPETSPRELRAIFIENLEAAAELIESAISSPKSESAEQIACLLEVRREIELAIALAQKTWNLD